MKRCPNGSRKNKKTGLCEPNANKAIDLPAFVIKRCPNGSRKNKKTGLCESKVLPLSISSQKQPLIKDSQKKNESLVSFETAREQSSLEKMKINDIKPGNANNKMVLQFHSKSALLKNNVLPPDALRRLSNFSEDSVELDSNIYPSVEHAFQAQKYLCSNKPELVIMFYNGTIKTAAEAKTTGGKGGMKKRGAVLDIECWDKTKDRVMDTLIKSKIQRNEYIRSILEIAANNNITFVHFSRSDMYWGAHMNEDGTIKKGLNKLGELYNKYLLR